MMLQLGVTRFALRSDNEPAILELKTQAARLARDRHGFEIMPEETPEGDSASNGLAEGAVRYIKAQCRVLRFAVEALHNVTLQPHSPILPWLVSYAATAINIARRGPDGFTPHQRTTGRANSRALPPFSAGGPAALPRLAHERVAKAFRRASLRAPEDQERAARKALSLRLWFLGGRRGLRRTLAKHEQHDAQ